MWFTPTHARDEALRFGEYINESKIMFHNVHVMFLLSSVIGFTWCHSFVDKHWSQYGRLGNSGAYFEVVPFQHQCRLYASMNWVSIGSCNGLSPVRRQTITWTNADVLSSVPWPFGTNLSEIRIKIHNFSFTKMHLKNVIWGNGGYFAQGEMS